MTVRKQANGRWFFGKYLDGGDVFVERSQPKTKR